MARWSMRAADRPGSSKAPGLVVFMAALDLQAPILLYVCRRFRFKLVSVVARRYWSGGSVAAKNMQAPIAIEVKGAWSGVVQPHKEGGVACGVTRRKES